MSKKKTRRNVLGKPNLGKVSVPAASSFDRPSRTWRSLALVVLGVLALGLGAYFWQSRKVVTPSAPIAASPNPHSVAAAKFVGAKTCSECHAGEYAAWQSSQHAKAMQHVAQDTVLGDFDDAKFEYNGIVSRFFRRDGRFFVTTDGKDGQMADFEILYTFGLYPLQQYLIAFPDGRIQALSIAWDARPKEQGGQRWYHLYADQHITSRDPLHWTRVNQNWNWMCAECHTTKLERNYDADANTYATTWAEMNVACEACHGPGSNHVCWSKHEPGCSELAKQGLVVALDERKDVTWIHDSATGNSSRSKPLTSERELAVCAQCHSRRVTFAKGMDHDGRLFETHALSLLTEPLYFADGQQHDEVYDVGSFLQSKMHASGVTCSDCHDAHSGKLREPGNGVCAQCHAPTKYDVPAHTLHAAGSKGAECAACHMPTRDYMSIDARHDHSIRIPRPDRSAKLETPNACNGCHTDRSAAWAAQRIENAFGSERKGFQTFATALHDGRTGDSSGATGLMTLAGDARTPAIVRATALAELRRYVDPAVIPAIERGLADPDPMVRGAALDALVDMPAQVRLQAAMGMMEDPSPIVRMKAARALAIMPEQGGDAVFRAELAKLFAEYVASQNANADRPESRVNLGIFYAERRDPISAEREYLGALAIEPDFVPAYVNLADMYRTYDREADAEALLTAGLEKMPDNADLKHVLGLLRVRQKRVAEALPLLEQAARADQNNARYAYVYGVALHDSGESKQGVAALERALGRFPQDRNILSALVAYARETGDTKRAERYAKRMADLTPPAAPADE